jgi:hypothetical protein
MHNLILSWIVSYTHSVNSTVHRMHSLKFQPGRLSVVQSKIQLKSILLNYQIYSRMHILKLFILIDYLMYGSFSKHFEVQSAGLSACIVYTEVHRYS